MCPRSIMQWRRPSTEISVDAAFLADQKAKAVGRAARFAAEAAKPPPPSPPKRMAWPGGKLTTNKADAVRKFIERKRESETGLAKEAEASLLASLQHSGSATVRSVDANVTQQPPSVPVGSEQAKQKVSRSVAAPKQLSQKAEQRRRTLRQRRAAFKWMLRATGSRGLLTNTCRAFFGRKLTRSVRRAKT